MLSELPIMNKSPIAEPVQYNTYDGIPQDLQDRGAPRVRHHNFYYPSDGYVLVTPAT
jgi:hypothetical protein